MLKYIFGPIPSRRLGMSLGIDLVPFKICNYDCIFCEVGKTKQTVISRKEYVKKDTIIRELDEFLNSYNGKIDHITLTGLGETTLNSRLGEIIDYIKEKYTIPVAVLTHSGNIYDKQVRKELINADVICPSLDAVSQEVFEKVNRPHKSIKVEKVIEGLIELRKEFKNKILLEVLLVKGINDQEEELEKLAKVCKLINPDVVQINTVDRPGAYPEAIPLSSDELHKAKEIILKHFPRVEVLSRHYQNPEPVKKNVEELSEDIVEILKRRPMTILDIVVSEGIDYFTAKNIILSLLEKGKIKEVLLNQTKFYKISQT